MRRKEIIAQIGQILTKHGIKKAYFFGSFAREEEKYRDIDLAIEPPKGFSLLDMAGIMLEMEDKTGKKIDIVSLRSINPKIREHIQKDLIVII